MTKRSPTPAQAQLLLQLYDLRREEKMRKAREWFLQNYHPQTLDEANRLTPTGSDESAYARMVTTYWDQACALLNYGLLHEELFFETTGEFFAVFEQIRPILPEVRERYSYPPYLEHLEKAAQRYEKWIKHRAPRMLEEKRKRRAQPPATAPSSNR
jgi:hypothetical protein